MFTTLWIIAVVILILVAAFKHKGTMTVEWRPILFGKNWVELVWLIIFIFSTINILLFISNGGRDAFALMSATVTGDIGARVGIGAFLLILSASQVFHFYEATTNVLAHGFLLLATAGLISMPSVNVNSTVAKLEAQLSELRGALDAQRPVAPVAQRATYRAVAYNPTPTNMNLADAPKTYNPTASSFYNIYLGRELNSAEIAWCKKQAVKGMRMKAASGCGYTPKPSTSWCNANNSHNNKMCD